MQHCLTLLACLLAFIGQPTLGRKLSCYPDWAPRKEEIRVGNGGPWGNWNEWARCPEGTFITGMKTRVEVPYTGKKADNTALNGIRLRCVDKQGNIVKQRGEFSPDLELAPHDGYWGEWQDAGNCASEYFQTTGMNSPRFVKGFRLKVQGSQGPGINDDTAANAIEMHCSNVKEEYFLRTPNEGPWGEWGGWAYCSSGFFASGIKVKMEGYQGSTWADDDDTALNDGISECTRYL